MTDARTLLFCSQSASAIGGVEHWLDQLCTGLMAKGWRPRVALVRGVHAHDPDRFRAAHPGLDTLEIDGRGLAAEGRVRAVMRCVRQVSPAWFIPLVVIDAHVAAARLRAAREASRYLLTLHGNTAPQLADARRLVPYADYAICPGALTTRLLAHFGIPPDRLRHVPNGARAPMKASRPRAPGAPIRIAYVGRLTAHDKRVGDLVPLVNALVARGIAFDLVVAGDGPERAALERALAGRPVRFTGALDAERLYREVYPDLDVLVLFSETEAFGIALVEALLHGVVPVTAAFVGQRAEAIVTHDETGLVFEVGDAEGAAACIARLDSEPATLRRLAEAGRRHVEARYTWDACIEDWDRALSAASAQPPREAPRTTPSFVAGPAGRLERLRVPPAMIDLARRARRAVFGVPAAMARGEEWPWAGLRHAPHELQQMIALRRSLDGPMGVA